MPDHLHALVEGTAENADLFTFIRRFKQRTAIGFASDTRTGKFDRPLQTAEGHSMGHPLWQRNLYEHIVRNRGHVRAAASYIWTNPVRMGLCMLPEEYPFSGSLTFGLKWNGKSPPGWLPPWKTLDRERKLL